MVSDRQSAISVLRNVENSQQAGLLKALYDLRYNAESGDEALLFPLLNHPDACVAASSLYSLYMVHDKKAELKELIRRLAFGDSRDFMEMPLQSMAIRLLVDSGKNERQTTMDLLHIATDAGMAEVPRKNAWKYLAELHNVEFTKMDEERMILDPHSNGSIEIQERIRSAIEKVQVGLSPDEPQR